MEENVNFFQFFFVLSENKKMKRKINYGKSIYVFLYEVKVMTILDILFILL